MNDTRRIPTHVAIIMDGNGRWAKFHGKERYEGHIAGVSSLRETLKAALRHNVGYLTLYAFSTENWDRPAEEVNAIMELFCKSVISETPNLLEQGVRVVFIGRRDRFSQPVIEHLRKIEEDTAQGNELTMVMAFDYSSREELTSAVRRLAERVERGEMKAGEITEQDICSALYTAGIPDPDLIIRTSGECRLSNFLLWQASYAEMYFPQVLWPDFSQEEFDKAMEIYAKRDRRYGRV